MVTHQFHDFDCYYFCCSGYKKCIIYENFNYLGITVKDTDIPTAEPHNRVLFLRF